MAHERIAYVVCVMLVGFMMAHGAVLSAIVAAALCGVLDALTKK